MQRLVSAGLWTEVAALSKRRQKSAAIAYVSSDRHLKFGRGDVLVVDASDEAIKSRETSADVLRRARKRGANIYSVAGLHAKCILLDREVGIVGSANLSRSSDEDLIEAGVVTDDAATTSLLASFIEQLRKQATEVDGNFISRVAKIRLRRQVFRPGKRKGQHTPRLGTSNLWLVSFEDVEFDEAEKRIEKKGKAEAAARKAHSSSLVVPALITGRALKGIREGDRLVAVEREGHTAFVWPPETILYLMSHSRRTFMFTEQRKNAEPLPWHEFKNLLRQAGMKATVKTTSDRRLPEHVGFALGTLWKGPTRRRRSP